MHSSHPYNHKSLRSNVQIKQHVYCVLSWLDIFASISDHVKVMVEEGVWRATRTVRSNASLISLIFSLSKFPITTHTHIITQQDFLYIID